MSGSFPDVYGTRRHWLAKKNAGGNFGVLSIVSILSDRSPNRPGAFVGKRFVVVSSKQPARKWVPKVPIYRKLLNSFI
jgi:hypothetical protein